MSAVYICRYDFLPFFYTAENDCAYFYDVSGVFTDSNSIDFTTNDARLMNPMEFTIDDWNVCIDISFIIMHPHYTLFLNTFDSL